MAARRREEQTTVWKFLFSWTLSLVLLAAASVLLAVWNLPAVSDLQSAHRRLESTRARVEREKAVVDRLTAEKEALGVDRQALERAAREEYLLLLPGEQVYVFQERRTIR